jgi:hypothetical protein
LAFNVDAIVFGGAEAEVITMRNRHLPLLSLLALTAGAPVAADTLIVQRMDEARATTGERPGRGLSMQQVTRRWGEPTSKDAAVGQPPITRWVYAGFIVYFEYDHVVHAVANRG